MFENGVVSFVRWVTIFKKQDPIAFHLLRP